MLVFRDRWACGISSDMWQHARRLSLLVLGVCLLSSLLSCTQLSTESSLDHPAITLLKAERSIAFLEPAWSPDGKRLAATGIERCYLGRCPTSIYVLEVESGRLDPITRSGSHADWTSDPSVLDFVESGQIYAVDLDENSPLPFAIGLLVSWSPDGRLVAIMRQNREAGPEADFTLAVDSLELNTGDELRVFETPDGAEEDSITRLAWSPDSTQLAISATWWTPETGYTGGVLLVNADGTNLRRASTKATAAGWMGDGKWLYFLVGDGQLGFAPLNFDCVLTPLDITDMADPMISPSGEQMVFAHKGNLYQLSLDRLLGENREKLVCPSE